MTTSPHGIELIVLAGSYYICRLPPDAELPVLPGGQFFSATRTSDELSVVAKGEPPGNSTAAETGFRLMRVAGTLDFSLVGVLAKITAVLADAGVSVFCISTYDTDYVLVRDRNLADTVRALRGSGIPVSGEIA